MPDVADRRYRNLSVQIDITPTSVTWALIGQVWSYDGGRNRRVLERGRIDLSESDQLRLTPQRLALLVLREIDTGA